MEVDISNRKYKEHKMAFLPTNYQGIPSESNYMKLEKGINKFRIVSSAVVGMEYWVTVEDKQRPVRKHMNEAIPSNEIEIDMKTNEPKPIRHFWAFVVWNYKQQKVQIMELTQKSIMRQIEAYANNEDWGDPKDYDLTITREGDGFDTEYSVIASPHKVLPKEVLETIKNTPVNLEALFAKNGRGEDPFKKAEA